MKYLHPFLLLFLFLCSANVQAQLSRGDCMNALPVCNKESLRLQISESAGLYDNELEGVCNIFATPLMVYEGPSYWLVWEVASAGDFYFNITTEDTAVSDLDFVVFKMSDYSACDQKEVMRCMFSGETIGNTPAMNAPCLGPTGLRPGETDLNEGPGCSNGDNNYLAPLECEVGDVYALYISDLSGPSEYFNIEFGGSAELTCDFTSSLQPKLQQQTLNLFPNPFHSGALQIELPTAEQGEGELSIHGLNGQLLAREAVEIINGRLSIDLSSIDLSGIVLISLQTQESVFRGKLLINN